MRGNINHDKGQYFALMADTITRYKEGKPIFYYTWMPNWIAAILRPGRDVMQVSVPFTSLPGEREAVDTTLPDGSNPGFVANNNYVLANREFAEANPAAARFFELFRFPIGELSAAMLRMNDEGKEPEKLVEIATDWVSANQAAYDAWVAEAGKGGRLSTRQGRPRDRPRAPPAGVIDPPSADDKGAVHAGGALKPLSRRERGSG